MRKKAEEKKEKSENKQFQGYDKNLYHPTDLFQKPITFYSVTKMLYFILRF